MASEFTLVIGNKNYSSWSLRAWLWMKHLNLAFDEKLVCLDHQDTLTQLQPYRSNRKVPILIHNGLEIWDSLAILEYLSELYPDADKPTDIRSRAIMRALCAEMHSSFPHLRNELPMNCRRESAALEISANCQRDIQRIEANWLYANQYSDGKGDWLFGSFTMADAMYAPVVIRLDRYDIKVSQKSRAYLDKVLSHPAITEWIQASHNESWVLAEEER